jgi:hypothetical protein
MQEATDEARLGITGRRLDIGAKAVKAKFQLPVFG